MPAKIVLWIHGLIEHKTDRGSTPGWRIASLSMLVKPRHRHSGFDGGQAEKPKRCFAWTESIPSELTSIRLAILSTATFSI